MDHNERLQIVTNIIKKFPGKKISELSRHAGLSETHMISLVRELQALRLVYSDKREVGGMLVFPYQQV